MAVGTTTSVKHSVKDQDQAAPQRGGVEAHVPEGSKVDSSSINTPYSGSVQATEDEKNKSGKHNHETCTSCGSPTDTCSCSKTETTHELEPAVKSATSSTVVCGGSCLAAAQRAAQGGCPGCECPSGNCPCTKCGCSLCGPHQTSSKPTPCHSKSVTQGQCLACNCATGNCPCTGCKCLVCNAK